MVHACVCVCVSRDLGPPTKGVSDLDPLWSPTLIHKKTVNISLLLSSRTVAIARKPLAFRVECLVFGIVMDSCSFLTAFVAALFLPVSQGQCRLLHPGDHCAGLGTWRDLLRAFTKTGSEDSMSLT